MTREITQFDRAAAGMRLALLEVQTGYKQTAYFGGVVVLLQRNGSRWRVAAKRHNGRAVESKDLDAIARAFGLRTDCRWRRREEDKTRDVVHECIYSRNGDTISYYETI
jgi:hypothetical protein